MQSAVGTDDHPPKDVWLCTTTSFSQIAEAIGPRSRKPFVVLVTADARSATDSEITEEARKLLDSGMVYACAWGPGCERIERLFDDAIVAANPQETGSNVVMTVAHRDEALKQAVQYFKTCTWPAEAYEQTCSDWIVVCVANPGWSSEIRELLLAN